MYDDQELLTPFEVGLLMNGKRLHAIRDHRARTNYGLRESMLAVNKYAIAMGMMAEQSCETCGGSGKRIRMVDGHFVFQPY